MNTIPIGVLVSTANPSRKNTPRPITTLQTGNTYNAVFGGQLYVDNQQRVFLDDQRVYALFDRFPFQTQQNQDPIGKKNIPIPIANPRNISLLCRDKWELQQLLTHHNIPMPEIARFHCTQKMKEWGGIAIAKPRHGSSGVGIYITNSTPPPFIEGISGQDEALIQQYIPPPQNWAGLSVRQLIQRNPDRSWRTRTATLRCSKEDPVVNVSRGATAVPAHTMLSKTAIASIKEQSQAIANILSTLPKGEWLVELGIDFVIDSQWNPCLIEVNTQPKGKLKALATQDPATYKQEHLDSVSQPLKCLAKWCQ